MGADTRAARDALSALAGRRTVLVVDDEPAVLELLSVMLELEGYVVLQADCGRAALDLARTESLDLITLDVMMPDIDGWEVADLLDQMPRVAQVPRMMVSGKPLVELDRAPGRDRAAAVLSKPFDFAEFMEIVRRLMARGLEAPLGVPEQRAAADEYVNEPGAERLYSGVQPR